MPTQLNPSKFRTVVERRRKESSEQESNVAADSPLDRYFRVLEVVANFPHGVTLVQMVEVLGLPKTTVHRLIKGLVACGALTALTPRYGPYVLGSRFLNILYSGMPDDWIDWLARPILKELADKTGETCFVARLSDFNIHSVAMVTPENDVRSYVVPGRTLTPHGASSAKAILAFQPESIVKAILPSPLPAVTDNTKTRLKDVLKEHEEIRQSNLAYCIGEDIPGFAGIASPIHVPSIGVKYSVAITGTIDDLIIKNKKKYSALVKSVSERLAAAMIIRLSQEGQVSI
ncbi:MAG: IclR family transcriptional regulator [Rhodospirillaceae bacterium]|nr:MAG: IclR family transcriptional regulator [Rhodospirillaceae bacterium]